MHRRPKTIAVVGEGLDALLVTLSLSKCFSLLLKRRLLSINLFFYNTGTAFTGSVLPGAPEDAEFYSLCGITERELIGECDAEFVLGYKFAGEAYVDKEEECLNTDYFGFGEYGFGLPGIPFSQIWKKYSDHDKSSRYYDYSISVESARQGKFRHPNKDSRSMLSQMGYALNLDVSKFCKLLMHKVKEAGVQISIGRVDISDRHKLKGWKHDQYILEENAFSADLIIDATRTSWLRGNIDHKSNSFFADFLFSSVEVESQRLPNLLAVLEQSDYGWISKHRSVGRQVFSGFHHKDEGSGIVNTLSEVAGVTEGKVNSEKFAIEYMLAPWFNNILVINSRLAMITGGLASPINVIQQQIKNIVGLLPRDNDLELCRRAYNYKAQSYAETILELSLLLDRYSSRRKSVFEVLQKKMDEGEEFYKVARRVSSRVLHRINLFCERGCVPFSETLLFSERKWSALMLSLGLRPLAYDPMLEQYDFKELRGRLEQGLIRLRETVNTLPEIDKYREFLVKKDF